jgi:hypothetical protein
MLVRRILDNLDDEPDLPQLATMLLGDATQTERIKELVMEYEYQ